MVSTVPTVSKTDLLKSLSEVGSSIDLSNVQFVSDTDAANAIVAWQTSVNAKRIWADGNVLSARKVDLP